MLANSALLLLLRSFSAAMLMLVSTRYFVIYLAGDMALYFLLKVLRGDFHYWVPMHGVLGLLVSLLMRICCKVIVDYTGVIQFRHPFELGGIYWTLNMFMALVASFVSVWIGGGGDNEWLLVRASCAAWVATFGLILLLMKKEYRGTFLSTKTGCAFSRDYFLRGKDDTVRSQVVVMNAHHWMSIREDVRTWVTGEWWRWVDEKPAFFNDSWVSKVPKEWIGCEEDGRGLMSKRSGLMTAEFSKKIAVI